MSWRQGLGARVRQLLARAAEEERMDDEIRFHIEMETEKNLQLGMSPAEARRRALIAFGGIEKHREAVRDGRQIPLLEDLLRDVRYAARSLRRTPGFTVTVVLMLAVGMGATSAMYGVMSRLLILPPPHVAAPQRVVKPYFTFRSSDGRVFTSGRQDYELYEAMRDGARTLAAVAAYTPLDVPVGAGAESMRVKATVASAGFWSVLGTRPALGRFFSDDEARPVGGARVAVLGHAFWRSHYGGDTAVLGERIEIKGHSYEIIGVTPQGFRGIEMEDIDLWLPISAYAEGARDSLDWMGNRGGSLFSYVARLRPGVGTARAEAELGTILGSYVATRPVPPPPDIETSVTMAPVTGALSGSMEPIPEAKISVWLVGISVVLLGVACATVASLLLLRAMRRRREVAVRLALGMGRGRLATRLFTESLLLSVLGGAASLAVAMATSAWINRVLLSALAWEPAAPDRRMMLLTGACVIGTALIAGLAPLLQTRLDPASALRDGVEHGSARRSRLHRALLTAQIALSMVLLIGAGLFLRSVRRIAGVDLGLDRDVLVATVDFSGTGRTPAEVAAFYERALERVRALPGVEKASLAYTVPLRVAHSGGSIQLPEGADAIREAQGSPSLNYVTPDFFATTGTSLLQGRGFLPKDRDGPPVIVINETMARLAWPGRSPLGECVPFRGRTSCATIVGVVENARKFRLDEPQSLLYYRPLSRLDPDDGRTLLIRRAPGATLGTETLRKALTELDPVVPNFHFETLGEALDPQIRPRRLGASVFTAFGALAMLLAAVGLYSALAYTVTQRTHEIGVRMALGAKRRDVLALVLRRGLILTLTGVVLGIVLALGLTRFLADMLFHVGPRDPVVFIAVPLVLVLVALAATLIPARRATRVDPMVALRAE